jgi:hypothetical protein|tara:strand:- start:797 stop:1540 length:744 start_codon:yes stop_codon:yes gene_type:complete
MAKATGSTDKLYKLKTGNPLSYTLASRNHPRFPLMWFDEKNNQNRALRYSVNQKSPFEDEQDGNAIIEPIIFEDGFLRVPRTNPVLQQFLHYHPLNGNIFMEVDKEKDASTEVEDLNIEVDALVEARQLTLDQIETLTRVLFGKDPSTVSTAELRRDILVYAKTDPKGFLNVLNDPELRFQAKVRLFFENKLLILRNSEKEVWFNTITNKKKMLSVPFGEDPYDMVAHFLQSDEGLDSLKMLESSLA